MAFRKAGIAMLLEKVRKTVTRFEMLQRGEGVVVATSGGPDSMVLLHLLLRLQKLWQLRLHVAHLDHGLRGEEGNRDAEFVRARAERWGLPVTVGKIEGLRREKGSLQEAARRARYRFLEGVAQAVRAERIALGHTQDDLAETVLINLLRGSGLRGLAGIPPARQGCIIRPLIEVSRKEVSIYADAYQIPFVRDSSNAQEDYLRNRIRLKLLPILAEYNPKAVEALARAALILREEDMYLSSLVEEALASLFVRRGEEAALSAVKLKTLPSALRRRVLREAFNRFSGYSLSWERTTALERLLDAPPGRLHLVGQIAASWEGKELIFASHRMEKGNDVVYPLSPEGETDLPAFGLRLRLTGLPKGACDLRVAGPFCAFLDAGEAQHPLVVRAWRPGDRFSPIGLGGSKKLQDFFVDAKVPRRRRSSIPLLLSGDRIAWVVGYRLDERFKVREGTTNVLKVEALAARPSGV